MKPVLVWCASALILAAAPAFAASPLEFYTDPADPAWIKGKELAAKGLEGEPPADDGVKVATADLNGDGRDEILVMYMGGWCGTLGCYTRVYTDRGNGRWEEIGHLHALDIGVGPAKGKGWRPLIADDGKRVTYGHGRYEGI